MRARSFPACATKRERENERAASLVWSAPPLPQYRPLQARNGAENERTHRRSSRESTSIIVTHQSPGESLARVAHTLCEVGLFRFIFCARAHAMSCGARVCVITPLRSPQTQPLNVPRFSLRTPLTIQYYTHRTHTQVTITHHHASSVITPSHAHAHTSLLARRRSPDVAAPPPTVPPYGRRRTPFTHALSSPRGSSTL